MNNGALQVVTSQLSHMIPTLLVCAFGFVQAMIYLRRCRSAALLTMLATCIIAVAMLGTALVQAFLMQGPIDPVNPEEFAQNVKLMGLVGVLGSVARAGALFLLLIAVFADRRGDGSDRNGEPDA